MPPDPHIEDGLGLYPSADDRRQQLADVRARGVWRDALRATLGHDYGELAVSILFDQGFMFASTFDVDPITMAERNGRRNLCLELQRTADLDPAQLRQMESRIKLGF